MAAARVRRTRGRQAPVGWGRDAEALDGSSPYDRSNAAEYRRGLARQIRRSLRLERRHGCVHGRHAGKGARGLTMNLPSKAGSPQAMALQEKMFSESAIRETRGVVLALMKADEIVIAVEWLREAYAENPTLKIEDHGVYYRIDCEEGF